MTTNNIWNPGSGPKVHGTRVLGTLRSDEHGNENVKNKQTNKQTNSANLAKQLCTCVALFRTFLCHFCTATTWNQVKTMRSCVRKPVLLFASPVVNKARKAVSSRCPSFIYHGVWMGDPPRISCSFTAVKFISLIYANFVSLFTTELEKLLLNDKTKACLPSIISNVINNKNITLNTVRLTVFQKR